MWTIILIIISLLIGLILAYKLFFILDERKYKKQYKEIFKAHKNISYPKLTDIQQFEILDNEDTKSVIRLTPYDFVPNGLLNYYINIEPDKYLNHLKENDLINRMRFDSQNPIDGFYINQNKNRFEYIFVERQEIGFKKTFLNYENLLKYIVYDRLKLYAPKKYKNLKKKYYC